MSRRIIFVFVYLFILLSAVQAMAAKQMLPKQWQELTNDKNFTYRNKLEVIEKPPKENFFQTVLSGIYVFFSSNIGKFIIWALFFLLLGWALYKIFLSDRTGLFSRKKETPEGGPAPTEEDLMNANWEKLLKQAMADNDVKLTVRYSYMWLLQLLQEKELINYRNDKTNQEYFAELGGTDYKQPFRQLSRQYEYAWYGNYPLSVEAYDGYMDTFNTVKNLLSRR